MKRRVISSDPTSLNSLAKEQEPGRSSLAATLPNLARQWHPTKNGDLTPYDLTPGSNRRVWWICERGHEWDVSVNSRTRRNSGCPYCSGRRASADNNLAVKNPELAKLWHPNKNGRLTPFDVVPGNQRKIWWLCENGHEWQDSPYNRRGSKYCPYCVNKRVTDENNLAARHPELSKEWHPTRNASLKPDQVVYGSGRTVWWQCEKGHEWKARIVDRANGRRCARCIGQRAHAHHNLALSFPDLAREWHPFKNGQLTPFLVTPRSNKKVWWQCKKGHEWESTVSNWAKGQNCPDCKPNTSLQEIRLFCELKTLFDGVLWRARLDGVECDIFIPRYRAAIEYDGAFWHMTRSHQDAFKNEKLAAMGIQLFRLRAHGLSPLSDVDIMLSPRQTSDPDINVVKILLGTMREALTLDEQDSKGVSAYLLRERFANPREFKRIVSYLPGPPIEKSVTAKAPELIKEWNFEKNAPLIPEMFLPGSGRKAWWICDKGHEWRAEVRIRVKGFGCPYCAGQRALPENNLAVKFPEIAEEWHPKKNGNLTPFVVTPKSHKIVWWFCKNGHEWRATPHHRANGTGCPYCAGKRVGEDNNLAVKCPDLAKQWHPSKNGDLTPFDVTPGSNRKVWWRCEAGHEWEAAPNHRSRAKGCLHCRTYGLTEENNFATRFPQLAKQWHPVRNGLLGPHQVTPMSGKKVWWVCSEGHEWRATVSNRAIGKGCPQCWKEHRRQKGL